MAFAEARAAWQRTANRCLVQEDAKRAPKLACCSSVPPSLKQTDTEPTSAAGGQEIPSTSSLPFGQAPSCSNLSPNSRWWLQLQPNYGFHKCLIDEQINSSEDNMETNQVYENSGVLTGSEVDPCITDQTACFNSSSDNMCGNFETCDIKDFSYKEEKDASELYFDSESSWIRAEKNTPWWRTADTEELAFIVAQRSLDLIENCDLPRPQTTHVKKEPVINIRQTGHGELSASLLHPKRNLGANNHSNIHIHSLGTLTVESACPKLRMLDEGRLTSGTDNQLRDSPSHQRIPEMHKFENDASKTQLLKALRHSQTRAREAEKAAKLASEEKEHVVKLIFRQASQIFAYKQWLHLLQLENMYFQYRNNKTRSASTVFPVTLPWMPQKTRKMRKGWQKPSNRKRAKRSRPRCDISKYAVVFALGLGLVGAGLLLGWTVGWMLPTW